MREIELPHGLKTKVDDEDYENLNAKRWHVMKDGYVQRTTFKDKKSSAVFMHREIMGHPLGMQIDHIDRDPLNNQRSNLRICTPSENQANRSLSKNSTSGFNGVTFHKIAKKWQAQISGFGKLYYLGLFTSLIDAAKAYDKKAIELFGEFACLNFPQEKGREALKNE